MTNNRPSLERVAFRARCPACGRGKIFRGLLSMVTHCPQCGLRIAAREQGDGPAFFGIVVVGALVTVAAAVVEILYEPPYWVHILLWPVAIALGSVVCLRFAKAAMLGIQYGSNPRDFQ
ncbi:MAG: DUF983 domain-containing protein [Alphaproteobacteria bacterium]|nr:DUF983 domain-containing protein [Alphaproteobacteria bacterium]